MRETKTKALQWILVALVATLFGAIFLPSQSNAATGINSQISFQGKVVTSTGVNLPDGNYNMQFKIYQDGTGCVAGGTAPCGGTLKYTDTRLVNASQYVTVTAGTFQVNLGALAGNPLSGIDWNQDTLWLSMNIGGTNSTASPTYDGEMTPFIRLTSVPYALNAGMVGGLSASQLVQLTPGSQQSGTVNVSGNITSGTSVTTPSVTSTGNLGIDSAASSTLNIGTTNATTVNVGTSSAIPQDVNFGGSNAGTVTSLQGGATTLLVGNTGATVQTSTNSGTAFQVQNASGAPVLLIDTTSTAANGTTVNYVNYSGFESGSFTNASTGWIASGSGTLSQNTNKANTYNGLYSALLTTTASNGGMTTSSFVSAPPSGTYIVSFFARVNTGAAMGANAFTVTTTGGTGSCVTTGASGVTTAGFQRVYCQLTATGVIASLNIAQNDGGTNGARTIFIDAVQLQSTTFNGVAGLTIPTPYQIGAIQLRGVITNPVAIINNGDSTSAFQIQNAAANSNLFIADTQNTRIGIGTSAPAALFSVGTTSQLQVSATGAITNSGTYNGNTFSSSQLLFSAASTAIVQSGSGQSLALNTGTAAGTITTNAGTIQRTTSGGSTTTLDLADTGTTVLKFDNSSSGAANLWLNDGGLYTGTGQTLRLDNAGNLSNIGTISSTGDATINGALQIGSATTDGTENDLQLDSLNTFADSGTCTTTSNQGAMYYNTNTGAMRACVNGSWEDMVSTGGLGMLAYGVIPDSANSGNIGELAGISQTTSPCKVYWASATSVTVAPCYAYSGGRKIIVPQTTIPIGTAGANTFVNVCLTGAGGAPALVGTPVSTDTATAKPTWSSNNPILCLATLDIVTANNITGGKIYDIRTFTTTQKTFVTSNVALGLGMVVVQSSATANLVTLPGATAAGNVRGVVVSYSGATSTTTANTIIATAGAQWVKATAGTLNGDVQALATGYTQTIALATTALNYYSLLGVATRTIDGSCTSNSTCQYSQFLNPLSIK